MSIIENSKLDYIYTYACKAGEHSLGDLEARTFFGCEPEEGLVRSRVKVEPSRSPFIRERLSVIYEEDNLQNLIGQVEAMPMNGETFKVEYINTDATPERAGFKERRAIEKEIGLHMSGKADLDEPQRMFGIMVAGGKWIFGDFEKSEPIWHHHQQKPHSYSTALGTRVARAVANIAVPNPAGIKAIDPCCGIGNVLVEALSMGIDIVGSDKNPLVLGGARENIAYFGLEGEVTFTDICDVQAHYDAAIIDLPYNLCCAITPEQQKAIIRHARRIADKVVVVTVEPIDDVLVEEGFVVSDRAVVSKGKFTREVIVCR